MKTHVEFRSGAFPPYEGEEDEINPGCYGKRLAEFLVRGLQRRGIFAIDPIAEDWGWIVPIQNDKCRLWIGCGNQHEMPDGFLCFIHPHKPSIRKLPCFTKVDISGDITALQQAIDAVLSTEPRITEKKWYSFEEFQASQ
jgi:hypothetical protein